MSNTSTALSNSDKLRYFIAPNMTDLITLLENNVKYAVYTGGKIHGIYRNLEMIGFATTLTTSGQRSQHFSPSYSIKMIQNLYSLLLQLSTRDR